MNLDKAQSINYLVKTELKHKAIIRNTVSLPLMLEDEIVDSAGVFEDKLMTSLESCKLKSPLTAG